MLVVEADKKIGVVVMKADGKPLLSYRKGNDFGCVVSLIPNVFPSNFYFGQKLRAWQRDRSSFTLSEKLMGAYFLQG